MTKHKQTKDQNTVYLNSSEKWDVYGYKCIIFSIFIKQVSTNSCHDRATQNPQSAPSHTHKKHRRPFLIKFSHLFVEDSRWALGGTRPAGDRNRKESEDRREGAINPIVQGVTLHLNVTSNFSPEGSNQSANNNNPFLWKGLAVYCFNNHLSECSVEKSQLLEENEWIFHHQLSCRPNNPAAIKLL